MRVVYNQLGGFSYHDYSSNAYVYKGVAMHIIYKGVFANFVSVNPYNAIRIGIIGEETEAHRK